MSLQAVLQCPNERNVDVIGITGYKLNTSVTSY
jgi:hypothetical protein